MIPIAIEEQLAAHNRILETTIRQSASLLNDIAKSIVMCFRRGNKVMLCGNGGSAADAQHVAAEFINRYRSDRGALAALALTTDTSVLTSIGNDTAMQEVFSRQIEALGASGDILVGLSTSGQSPNVLRALEAARARQVMTIGFTGSNGRETMAAQCDLCLIVPSTDTARIQECHEFAWHVICGLVEDAVVAEAGGPDSPATRIARS